MTTAKYYSDFPIQIRLDSNGDIASVNDGDAIKQSIKLLINSSRGSKIFNPRYGCRIEGFLFEPFDNTTARQIGSEIKEALENNESRIRLMNIDVGIDYKLQMYDVTVIYQIINTQQVDTIKVTLDRL